jgi:hypothetical protein
LEVSLKKIIVREMACVTKWELSEDVKTIVKAAESRFDISINLKKGSLFGDSFLGLLHL